MEHLTWIIPAVAVLAGVFLVSFLIKTYNGLVGHRNKTKNAWSQIDVQLQRRYDLIPNLVETAKGYMTHERETLEAVIRARQVCLDLRTAENISDRMKAEGALGLSLRSLFAHSENYPDLKANQNMLALKEELTSTENRIGFARQAYNDTVMRYNNIVEQFPANFVAGWGGFKQAEFWEVETPEQRKGVKIQF